MGLTLVAILTAALLLPGIIAARAFYRAAETREVEVAVPSLSTPEGISLVGAFSVLVHAIYVLGLKVVALLPPIIPLPVADPYLLFIEARGLASIDVAWALFSGLLFLSVIAFVTGLLAGQVAMMRHDKSLFYGPLSSVIEHAQGDDKFITAYVLSKIENEGRVVGYQGTVDPLFRDADRFPIKLVLKDVVPFYLELGDKGPERVETDQLIDWLVISSEDWHNIAFRVFQFIDEDDSQYTASA